MYSHECGGLLCQSLEQGSSSLLELMWHCWLVFHQQTNRLIQQGYVHWCGFGVLIHGIYASGMPQWLTNSYMVFMVCWIHSLPSSPGPPQRLPEQPIYDSAWDEVVPDAVLEICLKSSECALTKGKVEKMMSHLDNLGILGSYTVWPCVSSLKMHVMFHDTDTT